MLCTSHANVRRFADLLRERTDHDILAQGDADVGRLTRGFIEEETSVLVGTRSFWQGIDAPGVACVLVVIDRIPFPSPGDPLHAARRERAEAMELNAFGVVDLPAAALVLAQGAGRLLRTRDDHGVVAVLDSRLANRDYRAQLLTAMPPFKRSVDLDEACRFLAHATASTPPSRRPQSPEGAAAGRAHGQGRVHHPRPGRLPGMRRGGGRTLPRRERIHDGVPARRADGRGTRPLTRRSPAAVRRGLSDASRTT